MKLCLSKSISFWPENCSHSSSRARLPGLICWEKSENIFEVIERFAGLEFKASEICFTIVLYALQSVIQSYLQNVQKNYTHQPKAKGYSTLDLRIRLPAICSNAISATEEWIFLHPSNVDIAITPFVATIGLLKHTTAQTTQPIIGNCDAFF